MTPHQTASPFNVSYFSDANMSGVSCGPHANEMELS